MGGEEKSDLIRLLKSLPSGGTYDKDEYKPWVPYCATSGESESQHNSELSRKALLGKGLQLFRYLA